MKTGAVLVSMYSNISTPKIWNMNAKYVCSEISYFKSKKQPLKNKYQFK
jgi:hypothetical protein